MAEAKQQLLTHFGRECQIAKHDDSSCLLKLRWEGAKFTVTLTPNTTYITVQGPSKQTLPLARHIQSVVGGIVYAAKHRGKSPSNPSVATDHGATTGTTGAADRSHTDHGATEPEPESADSAPVAADHGATAANHGATSGVASSSVSGNDNIQVGTVIINEPPVQSERVIEAVIHGMMNLMRRT